MRLATSPRPYKTTTPLTFEQFHIKYAGFVLGLARTSQGGHDVLDDPEDIAQSVLISAWQHSHELLDSTSCYAWLREGVRLRVRNSISRSQKALRRVPLDEPRGCDHDGLTLGESIPDPRIPDSADHAMRAEVYDALRPRERTLLTLLNTGYGVSESARILGVVPESIRPMLRAAAFRYYGNLDA